VGYEKNLPEPGHGQEANSRPIPAPAPAHPCHYCLDCARTAGLDSPTVSILAHHPPCIHLFLLRLFIDQRVDFDPDASFVSKLPTIEPLGCGDKKMSDRLTFSRPVVTQAEPKPGNYPYCR
jgi:hypothetical protein